ncbi:MAG: glycine betaine ABC transporter substrate-binding protein [Pseudomonadota bacterium]|nr:glycine betaine ABC transporter substrate-binding protein [Pseudomonadota bacterium]
MIRRLAVGSVLLFTANALQISLAADSGLTVGSKAFTESVIISEIAAGLARGAGVDTGHRRALGGSRVVWKALLAGHIDAYPEYTGTLLTEILPEESIHDDTGLGAALAVRGIGMTGPIGFNNTYAIGMNRERADALGVRTITDLSAHPDLRFGFSNEFMDREDGWPGLRTHYRLPQTRVRGMEHDLAYRGLGSGALDATDVYSTDAEIVRYDLVVLEDDRSYFPDYQAVLLYRLDLAGRSPVVLEALQDLEGAIDGASMRGLNAKVKIEGESEISAAQGFLAERFGLGEDIRSPGPWTALAHYTRDHLVLVVISLGAAILVSVPLGIVAARRERIGQVILGVTGILQTIPSLALLVFMIPVLGIGAPPAIVALFLYSLLPIVRNTATGLREIPPPLRESAEALGLSTATQLRIIELPMALPTILAGIKTSAVINVGTATLGALIGAGGYGQPILTGIRLDDMGLILLGAVPAAVLALAIQTLFEVAERFLVPRGLRL